MSEIVPRPVVRWARLQNGAPIGEWQTLEEAPSTNTGFHEARTYMFAVAGDGFALHIDDEPLASVVPGSCLWQPGFYAGEVTAELIAPNGTRAGLLLLDVAPDPGKLGRDVFAQMIDEIWKADPTLVIGTEPAARSIGDLGETDDAWAAFSRLRQQAPAFLRALAAVRARPRRRLVAARRLLPIHHARRIDRQTALAALRAPALAAALAGGLAEAPSPITRVDVPLVEETVDSAANRALLALTRAVRARAVHLLARLANIVGRERSSDTRTPLASRWPARRHFLERFRADLDGVLNREPFSSVSHPEITAAGFTAIAADPTYARAWSSGWRALRRTLEGQPTDDRFWISPSWEIFERWCFVVVGHLTRSALPHLRWRHETDGHAWIGADGEQKTTLTLQPRFPALHRTVDGRWSVSKEREPDLVVAVEKPDGTRFIALDAKYRASRQNVLDAMESAHIYQDSLRIGERRPEASLLLVPAGGGAPWLEGVDFHRRHRVGVHVLAPGSPRTLPAVLSELLMS